MPLPNYNLSPMTKLNSALVRSASVYGMFFTPPALYSSSSNTFIKCMLHHFFQTEYCELGKHIRLTSIDENRDIVEMLQLAAAPCHPTRDCSGVGIGELPQVQQLTKMVDELSE